MYILNIHIITQMSSQKEQYKKFEKKFNFLNVI